MINTDTTRNYAQGEISEGNQLTFVKKAQCKSSFTVEELYQTKIFALYGRKTEENPTIQKAVKNEISEVYAQAINLYSRDAYRLINASYRQQQKIFSGEAVNVNNQLSKYRMKIEGTSSEVELHLKKEAVMVGKLLTEGLESLDNYSGELYRGDILTKKEYKLMKSGVYVDKAVMCFSKNKSESESFAVRFPMNDFEKYPVLITLKTKKGKNISHLTKIKKEDEVVIPPSFKFKVDNMEIGFIKTSLCRSHRVTFIEISDME